MISDNIYCINFAYYINSNSSHYINSNSLFYINSDIIDVYNLNSAFYKIDFCINFSFCKDCLDFVNVIFAHFTQNSDFLSML